MTAVTAADWWEESPAEAATADRRYWTDQAGGGDAEPVFEIGGQRYEAGDRVRFPNAGMRRNQARIYEITEAGPAGSPPRPKDAATSSAGATSTPSASRTQTRSEETDHAADA